VVEQEIDSPKIFIVEANRITRSAFVSLFGRLGCDVMLADSGESALSQLEDGMKPDVLLGDLELPEMSANDFLRRLGADIRWKSIPVVPYTPLIEYKMVDPQLVVQKVPILLAERGTEENKNPVSSELIELLLEHIGRVPGELILWVADALKGTGKDLPPLFKEAVEFLEERKKPIPNR